VKIVDAQPVATNVATTMNIDICIYIYIYIYIFFFFSDELTDDTRQSAMLVRV